MKKKKKILSIIMLAAMLVMQLSMFVKAEEVKTAPVKFTLVSDLPKQDGGSILLLYSGSATDVCVELRPENNYTYEATLPVGVYTLYDTISTIDADYSYDISDTLAIIEGENIVDVAVTNKDLTKELRQARAKDLTERNRKKEDTGDTGLKVGDNINVTNDVQTKTSKAPIVIAVILVIACAIGLTVFTTVRANKKKEENKEETLL